MSALHPRGVVASNKNDNVCQPVLTRICTGDAEVELFAMFLRTTKKQVLCLNSERALELCRLLELTE